MNSPESAASGLRTTLLPAGVATSRAAAALDPTLTVPKVHLGAAMQPSPAAAPTHEALRERLQRAAVLARQNQAQEALGEFEAVYTNYLTLGDPALAPIGAKAAYNRGVLLEKLLGDAARAEAAFEKVFSSFSQFDTVEIRTVAARSGLHAARLAGVLDRVEVAARRYAERLGPHGEYLPPLELRGFIADYRRLRAEIREREQGRPAATGLPEIVEPGELYSRHSPAGARTRPGPPAAFAQTAPTRSVATAETPPRVQPAGLALEPEPVRAVERMPAAAPGPTATLPRATLPAATDLTRDELHARLDAMDRRMAAYVADVRSEVGSLNAALAGANTSLANLQSQHLQLRTELQANHKQFLQDWQMRFLEMRDEQRGGAAEARAALREIAAEQRTARTVIVAAVLAAAAIVAALVLAHSH